MPPLHLSPFAAHAAHWAKAKSVILAFAKKLKAEAGSRKGARFFAQATWSNFGPSREVHENLGVLTPAISRELEGAALCAALFRARLSKRAAHSPAEVAGMRQMGCALPKV